jgi:hypothetical protein
MHRDGEKYLNSATTTDLQYSVSLIKDVNSWADNGSNKSVKSKLCMPATTDPSRHLREFIRNATNFALDIHETSRIQKCSQMQSVNFVH